MSDSVTRFPSGFTTRVATIDDVDIVADMIGAAELHDIGEVFLSREDIHADYSDPALDLAADVLLVFDGETLVAEVDVPGWRADGEVHPDYRGRGIGSALITWMESRCLARTPPDVEARVGQTKHEKRADVAELFASRGYTIRHTSWVLRFAPGATIVDRRPPGIEIRQFQEDEAPAVYQVVEDAFNEWPGRAPTSYESWRAHTVDRLDFDHTLLRVAVDTDAGSVVGACFGLNIDEGWVDQVAVRGDRRGQGIAQALLAATYEDLRARGHERLGLSTDSRTGALDLYLKLGMQVDETFHHWSKVLRPAPEG